jgi:hypothetical protein
MRYRNFIFTVLLLASLHSFCLAEDWTLWIEAENYDAQLGSQTDHYEMGATASGGLIVDNDWGRDVGDFLQWDVETPKDAELIHLAIRYARQPATPSVIAVLIDDQHTQTVRFPTTGGWGFQTQQWRFAEVSFENIPAGPHSIRIESASQESNLNTDGFLFGNRSFIETDIPDSVLPEAFHGERVALVDIEKERRQRETASRELAERLPELPPIAYIVQHRLGNPNGMVRYHAWPGRVVQEWGCRIEVLEPSIDNADPRIIFDDPDGAILDLNVSFDAKTLFFSHRNRESENWHLFEIGIDGRNLRQITDGPWTDFCPEELPDGRLVFCSTRIQCFNVCAQTLSTALYTIEREGGEPRQISVNTLNDYSPHVLPNGQIIYTRWEYVDRDVKWRQSLWTMNPDGSNMQLFFGNTIRDPAVFWQARPIPGTDEVLATFAPHHGWPLGAIGTVTRRFGPESPRDVGYRWITNEYPQILDNGNLTEWAYRDPFPIDRHTSLVSYGGGLTPATEDKRFAIYLLDDRDLQTLIHRDAELSCTYPLPLRQRERPPLAAEKTSGDGNAEGVFLLQNVYEGLGDSVEPGEIRALRIMEQPAKFPVNESGPRAFEMTPVMGVRCYYRKRCLGVVPVESDGSACFTAPAFQELYFQALDAEGRAVQSMGSVVNLAPGEHQTCIGCHEDRESAVPSATSFPLAARKPPSTPASYAWGNDGNIAFPIVVQPVLDRHCVECHEGPTPDARLDLSGDRTRFFSTSYDNIWQRNLLFSIQLTNNDSQVIPPKAAWSFASKLADYIEPSHYDVQLSPEEKERIYVWLDTNGNYYGTHERTRPGTMGGRDLWAEDWFDNRLIPLFTENCAKCHTLDRRRHPMTTDTFAWINLSQPENSLLLSAHLSRSSGGLELKGEDPERRPPTFLDKSDPIYQGLLESIEAGREQLLENPRVDMPGSQPRPGSNDWGNYPGTYTEN